MRAVRRRRPPSLHDGAAWPAVTMIRPIRGVDPGQPDNLRAALRTGYPGDVETIFALDDGADPGVVNAERAVQEWDASGEPGRARVLITGEPPAGRTGKLHAMHVASRGSEAALIGFGDSDTRPDDRLLAELVSAVLADDRVGCAFAPVVVTGVPRTPGDVGYAMLLNALYGPLAARASGSDGALPFVMGQIMVFRRAALESVGGVLCAEGRLVDDMAIGEHLHRAGWKNVMIGRRLPIVCQGLSLRAFFSVYRRWLLFGRDGLSIRFTWPLWVRAAEFGACAAGVGIGAIVGHAGLAFAGGAGVVAFGLSLGRLHRAMGGGRVRARLAWMQWAVLLLAPIVLASMTVRRGVRWRGRAYRLRPDASLASRG